MINSNTKQDQRYKVERQSICTVDERDNMRVGLVALSSMNLIPDLGIVVVGERLYQKR